jgi:DNA-binding LacI/PurR family transcriptional regulator
MAVTLKDIAITDFNAIPPAQYSRPSLTTVHQPVYHIGCMICNMLTKCRASTANP